MWLYSSYVMVIDLIDDSWGFTNATYTLIMLRVLVNSKLVSLKDATPFILRSQWEYSDSRHEWHYVRVQENPNSRVLTCERRVPIHSCGPVFQLASGLILCNYKLSFTTHQPTRGGSPLGGANQRTLEHSCHLRSHKADGWVRASWSHGRIN